MFFSPLVLGVARAEGENGGECARSWQAVLAPLNTLA